MKSGSFAEFDRPRVFATGLILTSTLTDAAGGNSPELDDVENFFGLTGGRETFDDSEGSGPTFPEGELRGELPSPAPSGASTPSAEESLATWRLWGLTGEGVVGSCMRQKMCAILADSTSFESGFIFLAEQEMKK